MFKFKTLLLFCLISIIYLLISYIVNTIILTESFVGIGMGGGARTGFVLGTAFCPGYGTALCTAFGLYLGGVGAGLSSSDCMD